MTPESALLGRIADDYTEIAALRARIAALEAENQQLRAALDDAIPTEQVSDKLHGPNV